MNVTNDKDYFITGYINDQRKFTRYTSIEEVNRLIPETYRYIGMRVCILIDGTLYDYGYYHGTDDDSLILTGTEHTPERFSIFYDENYF